MSNYRILSAALAVTAVVSAGAAPSRMRPVTTVAPDGTATEIVAMGDEHHHWYEYHASGEKVAWLPEVTKEKVTPAMRARHAAVQSDAARITPFPTIGEHPFLVVIVEFANKDFTFGDPAEEFDALLNAEGYSRYNGKGSAGDYYRDNSAGAFRPLFEVAGPVKLSRPYAYYGGGSDDSAAGLMVIEACQALDSTVDFSRYDIDGDGRVDNIYFFYAGKGEADGGDVNTIWPHSWNLSDQGRSLTLDGVAIDAYACSPELDGAGKPNGIGTFCHEFAHVLGLPDLYASSYTSALHPATWSLMASGNYNDDGRTPPGLSSYERYELGWLAPRELSYPLTVTLDPIGASNDACRISTERANEYFLFENRQQSGWDSSLPGHGMLVWHIDYNPNIWDRNVVNNTPSHQYVDIVEANNATSHSQDAGFPFPGTQRVTSFTSTTRPALVSWSGQAIDLPLTGITETSGVIRFNVAGGKTPVGEITGLSVAQTDMDSCCLEWTAAEAATGYEVTVEEGGMTIASLTTAETTAGISGLWPGHTYMATVRGFDRYEKGKGATVEVVMPEPTFEYLSVEIADPTAVTRDGFTLAWTPMDEADDYEINLTGFVMTEVDGVTCGFDNRELPDGWSTTSTAWTSVAGYYGEAAPALRFASADAMLTTGVNDNDITGVSLMARGSSLTAGTALLIEGVTADGETVSLATLEVSGTMTRLTADRFAPGIRRLTVSFIRQGSSVVSIDDVVLRLADTAESPVAEWTARKTGNVNSIAISGLAENERYACTVTALSGDRRSQPSRRIMVVTDPTSGLTEITETPRAALTVDTMLSVGDVSVYTPDGRMIMSGVSSRDRLATLTAGLYILSNPAGSLLLRHIP